MPKVYAPQHPHRFDAATKLWIPNMNLEPAKRFGDLVVLLPPNANRAHTVPLVNKLKELMADYGDGDYLIAVGDPSLIMACAMIAFKKTTPGKPVRGLKWDKMISDYIVTEIVV